MKKILVLLVGFAVFSSTHAWTAPGDEADISVTMTTDDTDGVNPDQDVTFTITTTNSGPDASGSIVVAYTVAPGLSFVSASSSAGTCTHVDDTVNCTLYSLASGSSSTLTIVENVTTTGLFTIGVTASITDATDPDEANNTAATALVSRNTNGSCSLTPNSQNPTGSSISLWILLGSSSLLILKRSQQLLH